MARERGYESWPKLVCQEHDDQPQFANEPSALLGVYQWFGLLYGTSGDQRTAGEIQALMQDAGFAGMECRPFDCDQSIVVGWKP
jgi:hypothetical protein